MRGDWDARRAAAIAVGGSVGAATRWAVLTSFDAGPGSFPWPIFALNVAGSLLLGLLLAEEWGHPSSRLLLHDAGAIGFCGGLTTFSTFSLEVVDLAREGAALVAAVYAAASVLTTIVAVGVAPVALRRARSLTIPLEEEP